MPLKLLLFKLNQKALKHVKGRELAFQNGNTTFHFRKLLRAGLFPVLIFKMKQKISVLYKLWIYTVVLIFKIDTPVEPGDTTFNQELIIGS